MLAKDESVLTAVLTSVPDVGSVTAVVPVTVSVVPKLPLIVSVLAALLAIPVPPYAGPIIEAFQVPLVIVPTVAKLDKPATAVFTNVPDVGKVTLVEAVVVNVVENPPAVASVDPSASVSVAPVAGAVIVSLFTVVAVATPIFGVVNDGEVANAKTVPEPVVEYDVPHAEPVELAIPAEG
jgi:hypothetical protein